MLFKTAFLFVNFTLAIARRKQRSGWHWQKTVLVAEGPEGSDWGKWSGKYMCPENHYAVSGRVSDQPLQGSGDDTALNGYQMQCREVDMYGKLSDYIEHREGYGVYTRSGLSRNGGVWGNAVTCPKNSFIFQHRVRMEPALGGGDDTAINGMSLGCRYGALNRGTGRNLPTWETSEQQWDHGMTQNNNDHYTIADAQFGILVSHTQVVQKIILTF